jgi:hypothetical protein
MLRFGSNNAAKEHFFCTPVMEAAIGFLSWLPGVQFPPLHAGILFA